jgi:hypothetical protein
MSRGFGRVERQILAALQASTAGHAALEQLGWLLHGTIADLNEEPHCGHVATIRWESGTALVVVPAEHTPVCFPSRSLMHTVARAVRSLERKRLVVREQHVRRLGDDLHHTEVWLPEAWTQQQARTEAILRQILAGRAASR